MKRKTVWLPVLALVLLLGGAAFLYDRLSGRYAPEQLAVEQTPAPQASPQAGGAQQAQTGETAGEETAEDRRAPDFTAYDADGNAVRLSDYFGKPLVLNFWASWCGPCKSEMPEFQQAYEEQADVQFLLVNMTTGRETQADAQALLEQERLGALRIVRWAELPERSRAWVLQAEKDTILEHGLLTQDTGFARYMRETYPDSWALALAEQEAGA